MLDELADDGVCVSGIVARRHAAEVEAVWRRGWAPAEVTHVVERRLSAAHAAVSAASIVADARQRGGDDVGVHPRWRAQIDELSTIAHVGEAPRRASVPVLDRGRQPLPARSTVTTTAG